MNGHLSDAELGRFVRGLLPPAALVAADDHLAGCDACRTRAARIGDAESRLFELQNDVLAVHLHLSDEQIQHYVRAEVSSAERAGLDQHLRDCPTCAAQVRDLQAWTRRQPAGRSRLWLAAAAAVLLLLAPLGIWLFQDRQPMLAGVDLLSPEERSRVTAALEAGEVSPPEFLTTVTREVLMGTATPGSFRLLAPLQTITLSDRPAFQWEPLPDATEYSVAVLDENLREVTGAARLTATTWTPPEALARGESYVWQVTAQRGRDSVIAPVPPAPLARFRVMDETTAATIDRVSRAHPESHLLLGILCAQAGARTEAELHLSQVPATDAQAALARRTLERLRGGP